MNEENTPSTHATEPRKPLLGKDESFCDKKGRLSIGKKNMERLGEKYAMSINKLGVLVIYPDYVWQEICEELESYSISSPGYAEYARLVMSSSDDDLSADDGGRLIVPLALRTEAGIVEKEVLVLGCGKSIEVWPLDEFKRFKEEGVNYRRGRREEFDNAYSAMKGSAA